LSGLPELSDRLAGYARLYGGVLPVLLAVSLFPQYRGDPDSLAWETAWQDRGLETMTTLVALLLFLLLAAMRPAQMWPVTVVTVLAAMYALALVLGFGSQATQPRFSSAGRAGMVLSLSLIAVTLSHRLHHSILTRRLKHDEAFRSSRH
jgi:hypothetical protein